MKIICDSRRVVNEILEKVVVIFSQRFMDDLWRRRFL